MNVRDRLWFWALILASTGLPACGGSAAVASNHPVEYEPESPVELEGEQVVRLEELETALARTDPQCGDLCELGETICDLRDRICGIAGRHPSDAETQDRCRDATERCDRGRERVVAVCSCEP